MDTSKIHHDAARRAGDKAGARQVKNPTGIPARTGKTDGRGQRSAGVVIIGRSDSPNIIRLVANINDKKGIR